VASGNGAGNELDNGDIPADQQWRHDQYLAGPSANKLAPDDWYAAAQRV
jgi:hypothetical protein